MSFQNTGRAGSYVYVRPRLPSTVTSLLPGSFSNGPKYVPEHIEKTTIVVATQRPLPELERSLPAHTAPAP